MADEKLLIFGNHLRGLRLAKGITQEGLAERAGLHPTYIGGVERGERNLGLSNLFNRHSGQRPEYSSLTTATARPMALPLRFSPRELS